MVERLNTRSVAKPWGRDDIPAYFGASNGERIGEIWFEPSPRLDQVLAKLLFTSEKLSVQVHPDDAHSPTGRGKDECWLILDADPGASVALGFSEEIDPRDIPSLAAHSALSDRLQWHAVEAGDFFYVPAGTVHAIGGGILLVEVQQNTDITYRMFDYGRPRELHVEQAAQASKGTLYPGALRCSVSSGDTVLLVDGPYFRVAHVGGQNEPDALSTFNGPVQIVVLAGTVDAEGTRLETAQSAVIGDCGAFRASPDARYLVIALADND